MRKNLTLPLIVVTTGVVLIGTASSKKNGILPSQFLPLTRSASASCGTCHNPFIGGPKVSVTLGTRLFTPAQNSSITVSASGGVAGTGGGFACDVTAGSLGAGTNSRVSVSGNAITHVNPNSRSWTFGYKAPSKPGPVELYAVVNTVNGNDKPTGDQHAFFGFNSSSTVSTPVRMYVNAPGVVAIGKGCADGYGNVGVYGAPETPSVGNTRFRLEAIGLPPAARVMFILGMQKNFASLDLGFMGAPGCFLHSDLLMQLFGASTAGNAERSEGRFSLSLPIPSMASLKGVFFRTQVGAVDSSKNARSLPVVFTNGLGITIR